MRKDLGMGSGWLGYSYSRTRYQFAAINQGDFFAPRHDRSHTLNLVSNIDVKNALRVLSQHPTRTSRGNLTLGVNFVYSSGQPITEPGSGYYIGSDPAAPYRRFALAPTRVNALRLPYYGRLDLSLTWHKQYRSWAMEPFLQIYNVGNRRNVWFVEYEPERGVMQAGEINMFPILPTLGVNFKF